MARKRSVATELRYARTALRNARAMVESARIVLSAGHGPLETAADIKLIEALRQIRLGLPTGGRHGG